ncbi:MAG: hypothetical protein IPH45_03505 [Bacteroidales bacterium]|nr:hypothetical protein [Bacteroidales bacterium]
MKTHKKDMPEKEKKADSVSELPLTDEMGEIRNFIQKRRLQNKILKKITEELQAYKVNESQGNKTA